MSYDIHALRAREFPWAERGESIYLDHASTGPLPMRTRAAIAEFLLRRAEPFRLRKDDFFPVLAQARAAAARLVGADASSIALMTNTSHGINLAARTLPYGRGDVILSTDGEFPANVYPWIAAAQARGAEHRMLPLAGDLPDEEALMRVIANEPRVKVVALSWVSYWSGHTFDLAAIGAACRARGIWFVVDAIQGIGPRDLNLAATHVDVLACGAQKWLCSPWGTGFVYVRPELVRLLEPAEVGWMAQPACDDFGKLLAYDSALHADARRFEVVTLDFLNFQAMAESIGLFLELGSASVAAHLQTRGDNAVQFAASDPRITLVTPAEPSRRAGLFAFRTRDVAATSERLRAARVAHSVREGCVRLSPHFYTTVEEFERALTLLA